MDPQPLRGRHGKAKRHHYVPEMILRRFAGPNLHLWSFDERNPGYGIERKPIARLFREWDLYTSVDADGRRDRSAETRLSAMESRAGPVLDRIVAEARQGRLAAVSSADREALTDILVAQLGRSPDFFDRTTADWDFEAFIAERVAEWEAAGRTVTDADRMAGALSAVSWFRCAVASTIRVVRTVASTSSTPTVRQTIRPAPSRQDATSSSHHRPSLRQNTVRP